MAARGVSSKRFEPIKKNGISLRNDELLDTHLKPLRIGGRNTPLELSKDEVRLNGDLYLDGNLSKGILKTEQQYLELIPLTWLRINPTLLGGHLDLFIAGGDPWLSGSGDEFVFTCGNSTHGSTATYSFRNTNEEKIFSLDASNTRLRILDDSNTSDYFDITVSPGNGATTISTVDADAALAHLELAPDGDLVLAPVSQKPIINATDGLYFDGGTHTYIYESTDDVLRVAVGGDIMMQLSEKGDDGNEVSFGSSCVGFTQLEPTFDGTNTYVDFRLSNKQFLTFGAASITNLNVRFPLVSGNFVLLIKQDGTGSRTITNWKVQEFDETAADGSNAVKFAGGSNPTLTTDANHVDIISFYWDADNEIAYGVATLDFQF